MGSSLSIVAAFKSDLNAYSTTISLYCLLKFFNPKIADRLSDGSFEFNKRSLRIRIASSSVTSAEGLLTEELAERVEEVFTLSEKDRERIGENGEVYLIPELVSPTIVQFPVIKSLNY